MKSLILTVIVSLTATQSFAATVKAARLDAAQKNILVDVTYGGGCAQHSFKLELNPACAESYPVQCTAQLIETTDKPDFCEAFISTTAVINLEEAGLTDRYYKGAKLTITGDQDWQTKKPSAAVVRLP